MRIGVISDTHNHMRNVARIVELLNDAAVDRVVHTGDITQPKTLDALSALRAPLFGVFGNNDLEREGLEAACATHGFHFVEPPLEVSWNGRRVAVVHDPLDLQAGLMARCDVALHGHVHEHVREHRDGTLVFNPGECAGHQRGWNAVGIVDLASLATEILRF